MKWLVSFFFTILFLIFFALYAFAEPNKAKATVIIVILGTILGVILNLRQKK